MEIQEQLARLQRRERAGDREESSRVSATGAAPAAWTVTVTENLEYNRYTVQQVKIMAAGSAPVTVGGSETQAYNLAESFTEGGQLAAGTIGVMWQVGDVNVIQIEP
ncbi:MAG: hypothetical protein JW810_03785 [Sedimentisphaerales bacterium]|nr:hypothetical protein [Sedimentisphaerales bacterium]